MKHKLYSARVSFCNHSDTHIGNNVQAYKFQNYTNVHSGCLHQSSLYVLYAAEMQKLTGQLDYCCGSSVYVTQPHKITYFSSYFGGEVSG